MQVFDKRKQLPINLSCELHRTYYFHFIDEKTESQRKISGLLKEAQLAIYRKQSGVKGVPTIQESRAALLSLRNLFRKEEVSPHPASVMGLS